MRFPHYKKFDQMDCGHEDEDYSEKPKKCFYDPYTASWNDDEAA